MRMMGSTVSRTELPKTYSLPFRKSCLRLLHVFVSFLLECPTFISWNYVPSRFLLNKNLFPRCLVCFLPSGGGKTFMAFPVKHMTSKYMISSYISEFKALRGCCRQTDRQVCLPPCYSCLFETGPFTGITLVLFSFHTLKLIPITRTLERLTCHLLPEGQRTACHLKALEPSRLRLPSCHATSFSLALQTKHGICAR